MAGGSSQTIDRIQVEINFNSGSVDQELNTIISSVNSAKGSLSSLESATKSSSDRIEDFGSAAKEAGSVLGSASGDIGSFSTAAKEAGTSSGASASGVNTLGTATQKTGTASQQAASEVEKLTSTIEEESTAAQAASQATSKTEEAIGKMGDKGVSTKEAVGKLKGALGGLGITLSMVGLLKWFKDLAQASIDAKNSIQGLEQGIRYQTGDLTDTQKQMYQDIINYDAANGHYGYEGKDLTKVSTAIAMVGQAQTSKGMSYDLQKQLANEYLSLDLMGKGNIDSIIQKSSNVFEEWGVSAENQAGKLSYLRTVSDETGVGFEDLLTQMVALAPMAEALGLTFSQLANVIGSYGFNTDKRDEFTNEVVSALESGLTLTPETISAIAQRANSGIASGYIVSSEQKARNARTDEGTTQAKDNVALAEKALGVAANIERMKSDTIEKALEAGWSAGQADAYGTAKAVQGWVGYINPVVSPDMYKNNLNEYGVYELDQNSAVEQALDSTHNALNVKIIDVDTGKVIPKGTVEANADITKQPTDKIQIVANTVDVESEETTTNSEETTVSGKSSKKSSKSDEEDVGFANMDDVIEGMEDYTSATEEAGKVLGPFTTDILDPMNASLETQGINLTYNYDEDILINDYSINTLQPTMIAEKGVVDALAAAYRALAAAKREASAA